MKLIANTPIWVWAVSILTAIAFIGAGSAKLAGVEMVHLSFANMGLPPITGYIVGALEIAGAVGIFVKSVRFLAALGLAATSLGAFLYHLAYTPVSEGIPALVLLVFTVLLARYFKKAA
ncbi:DoxX-like protein [Pacificibacter maritimus]|uniref:DoxX-like protein n=1 Tax=Pacificibacter maritimus TaxID=762213 RepID=A0A3N4UW77_9RHOB|nr:DoxX family protein [Pacificibacter maritimus]RPE71791.1 DoxX-like protein [Pacificibacter maritimus]